MKKFPYSPGLKRKSMNDDILKTNPKPGLSVRRSVMLKPPPNLILAPFNSNKNNNEIVEDR